MKFIKVTSLLILLLATCSSAFAGETADSTKYHPIGAVVQLESAHLWRGIEITDELNATTDFFYRTKNDAFHVGLWGGAGVTGKYKEFDYYASYKVKHVTFALWDIYNFGVADHPKLFDYNPKTTTHLIDLSATYVVSKKVPLTIYWATVLTGADRSPLNDNNRYSTYIQFTYPILRHKFVDLNIGLAGGFAFHNGIGANGKRSYKSLYGDHAGISNITLTALHTFKIGKKYQLPVYAQAWWNTQLNYGNLLINCTVFSF